jgi:HAD superfamily hydrolase (TIGR01548 family)
MRRKYSESIALASWLSSLLFLFCGFESLSYASISQAFDTPDFSKSGVKMSRSHFKTLLMDMDGVLAEVSKSYRAAIVDTCHIYGATSVTQDTVTEWKMRGNANDDWKLTYDLINDDPNGRKDVTLADVTSTFESLYQGDDKSPGLYQLETLIPARETLLELRKRSKPGIGIVTGRPRSDCMKFLRDFGLEDLVDVTYCMEDGPSKPDPYPVVYVCEKLGIEPSPSVVLVGDTPDDISAAVAAGCSGVGVITPEALCEQLNTGQPFDTAPLCVAMKKVGADCILEPGFSALVDRFAPSSDE